MTSLKHESIVNVVAVGKGPYDKQDGAEPRDVLFIVMEYAEHGELFDMLSNTGKFSEETARYFFKQLLNAIFYLHNTAGICHRDLKPENILIDSNFNLKIADFGFSIPLAGQNGNGKLHSYKGTLGYMPPEQLAKKAYSGKQADLFALGIVLFMMLTQCQPFEQAKVNDKYYRLIAGNKPQYFWKTFSRVTELSEELKDLITGMLQLNPDARFTLDEILAHPWVQGETPTDELIQEEFRQRVATNSKDLKKQGNKGN